MNTARNLGKALVALLMCSAASACQGGLSADPPAPAASPAPPITATFTVGDTNIAAATVSTGANTASLAFAPLRTGSVVLTLTGSPAEPVGAPSLQPVAGANASVIAFISVTATAAATFSTFPVAGFTVQGASTGANYYLAYLPPGGVWQAPFLGPTIINGTVSANPTSALATPAPGQPQGPPYITFAAAPQQFAMAPGRSYLFALYSTP